MPQHEHASDDEEHGGAFHRRTIYINNENSSPPRNDSNRRAVEDGEIDYGMQHFDGRELHHRQRHRDESRSMEDLPYRYPPLQPPPIRGNDYRSRRRGPTTTTTRRKWVGWSRVGVVSLVAGYLIVVFRGSQLLNEHESMTREFPPGSRTWMFESRKGRMQVARERIESKRQEKKKSILLDVEATARSRAQRVMPARAVSSVPMYDLPHLEKEDGYVDEELNDPADFDDICGIHAQYLSQKKPGLFRASDVLNRRSRVLITGILSPIGMNLALALKEKCGVEVIAGIDSMFPNTVAGRLELQKRIQMLTTNIPKLLQPILLPYVGLDLKQSKQNKDGKEPERLRETDERSLLHVRPTHIIHLAPAMPDAYRDIGAIPFRNTQSPYSRSERSTDLFPWRASLVSTEQILASLMNARDEDDRPHFVFASSTGSSLHDRILLTGEVLTSTYSSLFNVQSVGVKLPNGVYGPWSQPGTVQYDLFAHRANPHDTPTATNSTTALKAVFVDDIVDGLIGAMQLRPQIDSPTVLDFDKGQIKSPQELKETIDSVWKDGTTKLNNVNNSTTDLLRWQPATCLESGFVKTLAWHMDRSRPFGTPQWSNDEVQEPVMLETGDQYRKRVGSSTCSADDVLCHKGQRYLPCCSECSSREQCLPSVFDSAAEVVRNVTVDCDVVLYTQSLGYEVRGMKLLATYSEEEEIFVCNVAFIPRESRLVNAVIKSVPDDKLFEYGIPSSNSTAPETRLDLIKNGLNGLLLYKGWFLVWVEHGEKPLSPEDHFVLKLSPGKLFSSDVKHAVYVDENFRESPTIEDVVFLVRQTYRLPMKRRSMYRKLENGKKKKYVVPAEPERRAVLLLSPMRWVNVVSEGEKLTVLKATKIMLIENGADEEEPHESPELKKQREFYERVPSFVNRMDMRSPVEPWYRYDLKHWIRSRWIVHDLKHEQSRQLRCEWYQEHVQWGNDLDQLSFAHIMAVRELKRRMLHQEPDDHFKPAHIEHPELAYLTDAHEWFSLDNHEGVFTHPSEFASVPAHMYDHEENSKPSPTETPKPKKSSPPLFVRIVSERVMTIARSAWEMARRAS